MSVDRGLYTIQNVMHRSIATQSPDSTVVADAETGSGTNHGLNLNLRMVWYISRLNNHKYTIKNVETSHYAATAPLPKETEAVVTKRTRQQWVIKETGFRGTYVIYTTAAHVELFWGLTDGELLTPISLRVIPNHPSNHWVLTKVASRRELEEEICQLRAQSAECRDEMSRLRESVDVLNAEAARERKRHEQVELQLRAQSAVLQEENKRLRISVNAKLQRDSGCRDWNERTELRRVLDILDPSGVEAFLDTERDGERPDQSLPDQQRSGSTPAGSWDVVGPSSGRGY